MMERRQFLSLFGTALTVGLTVRPTLAQARLAGFASSVVAASDFGVVPNSESDQSAAFQAMLERAAAQGAMVQLAPGTYRIANVALPEGTALIGTEGKTRLVQAAPGRIVMALGVNRSLLMNLDLVGLEDDWSFDQPAGLADFRHVNFVSVHGCTITGGGSDALYFEHCGGEIARNTIRGAARFGLFSIEGRGLAVSSNTISDCGNGGIIVHRWQLGADNSTISGNTIRHIRADNGGTGQWGNGVNLYQTRGVAVANNLITDCAFSAIRANAAQDFQYQNNTCLRSGETALYAEFGFRNAFISGNTVDGATNGVSVTNFNEGGRGAVVSLNTVRNLSLKGSYPPMDPGFGIGIFVEADTQVIGNTVENAPRYGINAGWGPHLQNVTIARNTVRRAEIGIGVSAAPGAGTAMIHGNVINARSGAIIAHAWAEPVGPDLLAQGASIPKNIELDGNDST